MADFNNPWTILGAGMMAGADPNRQGLGGLGEALLNTQSVMSQQGQLEAERQRQQALADLQLRTFNMKMQQQQRDAAAREAFAASPGMTPAQQAAIRAGYGGQVATGMSRQEPITAIIGEDGTPVYVPQSQAVGQQPFKSPLVQVGTGKPPNIPGYLQVPDPNEPTGYRYERVAGAPEKARTETERSSRAIAQEMVRIGEQLESALVNEDGTINADAVAQMKVPGTPLYKAAKTLAQNEVYLKSGAAATAEETRTIEEAQQPGLISTLVFGNDPASGIRRAITFAKERTEMEDEPAEQPQYPAGWSPE